MEPTLHTKVVPAHRTEEGIDFPEQTMYRYTDEAGAGGIWHLSESKALASFERWEAGAESRARRRAESERLRAASEANPYADDPFARFEVDQMRAGGNHIPES